MFKYFKVSFAIFFLCFCFLTVNFVYPQTALQSVNSTPQILFSPQPLYFGNIPECSCACRELMIYNLGSADANISGFSIQGEDNAFFALKTDIGSYVLRPLEILVLEIEFIPSQTGDFSAEFVMESNAPSSPDKVTLSASVTRAGSSVLTFERIIGTTESDGGSSIIETPDGGFLIVGSTILPDEDYSDAYVVKTDYFGKVEWMKNYGGDESDNARDVQCTDDNGFLIAGVTDSYGAGRQDVYLLKLNSAGEQQWRKTHGGKYDDRASCLKKLDDGNFIIAGNTKNTDDQSRNAYLLKIDASGEEIWSKNYGGDGGETVNDILLMNDGGFLVLGSTTSIGAGEFDVYLFKTDASGNVEWEKTYGGTDWEEGNSIHPTSDGGYMIAGFTVSQGAGARDMYYFKIDEAGNMQWEKTFGYENNDGVSEILVTPDGGCLLGGSTVNLITDEKTYSDILIVRTDASGEVEWTKTFGSDKSEGTSDMLLMADGGFLLLGSTGSYSKDNDIYLLRLSDSGGLIPVEKIETSYPADFNLSQNYPNPFNNSTCIMYNLPVRSYVSLEIYNIFGQRVCTLIDNEQIAGAHQVVWDASNYSSGMYFCFLKTDQFNEQMRMILLK